jgi:hypothetical protein
MSTIRDALERAQKERDALPDVYRGVADAVEDGPSGPRWPKVLAVFLASVFALAGGAWVVFGVKEPGAEPLAVSTAQKVPAAGAVSAEPAAAPAPAPAGPPGVPLAPFNASRGKTAAPGELREAVEAGKETARELRAMRDTQDALGQAPGPGPDFGPGTGEKPQEDIQEEYLAPPALPVYPAGKLPPEVLAKFYDRGVSAQMAGNTEQARRQYETCLRFEPDHAESRNNLAVLDMENGRLREAEEGFLKAATAREGYVDPYYNLACLFAKKNDTDKAVYYLRKAAALSAEALDWAGEDKDLAPLLAQPGVRETVESKK